ncbi:acyltransferase [Pseudoflavitalea sp. X16]|uniref:acyltransferase family protein n=1 Tax=Paraflavitalea devenefica TaxID=2716334 RepID=UPI00141F7391|nr:acyltransferase [Paraflavitalea devenefica]NII24092.1 acyltransferase [Paraflavitalea devenefica]
MEKTIDRPLVKMDIIDLENEQIGASRLKLSYYSQLDGLRFVSIFGVLFQHFINPHVSHFFLSGNAGVDLFFVISGFLITESLLSLKKRHSVASGLKVFYVRRTLRIFPLYYLYWSILLIFFFSQVNDHKWWGLFYSINFYDIYDDGSTLTGHLWSLAVEEQFYILWPVMMLLIPSNRIIGFIISILLVATGFIFFNFNNLNQNYNYFHTLSCSIALITGAALACIKNIIPQQLPKLIRYAKWLSIPAFLTFLYISIIYGQGKSEDRYLIFIRFCICVIGFFWVGRVVTRPFTGIWGRFLQNKWVQRVGQVSYGIYISLPGVSPSSAIPKKFNGQVIFCSGI